MEPGVIVAIVLILLIGGTAALVSRQRSATWGLPSLRTSGAPSNVSDELLAAEEMPEALAEATRPGIMNATTRPANATALRPELETVPSVANAVRLEPAPVLSTVLLDRLERIESRLSDLQHEVEQQHGSVVSISAELQTRAETEKAQREAALERLRLEVVASLESMIADRQSGIPDRRAEVSGDLYARLARLESALAAVTNPILLPGEAYAPPAELPAEALIWENWNEVGERTFALADAYSAQRLHLSDQASAELGEFVTAIRVLLTRSVYPNVRDHPDAAQQAALHAALEKIAAELPRVRDVLHREYRGGA